MRSTARRGRNNRFGPIPVNGEAASSGYVWHVPCKVSGMFRTMAARTTPNRLTAARPLQSFDAERGLDWMRFAGRRPHARLALHVMGLVMRRTTQSARENGKR